MQVFVKSLGGGYTLELNVNSNVMVYDLKRMINHKQQIEPQRQRLFLNGNQLEDNHVLNKYSNSDQTIIQLIVRTLPIEIPKPKFSSFYCEYRERKSSQNDKSINKNKKDIITFQNEFK